MTNRVEDSKLSDTSGTCQKSGQQNTVSHSLQVDRTGRVVPEPNIRARLDSFSAPTVDTGGDIVATS